MNKLSQPTTFSLNQRFEDHGFIWRKTIFKIIISCPFTTCTATHITFKIIRTTPKTSYSRARVTMKVIEGPKNWLLFAQTVRLIFQDGVLTVYMATC